MKKILITAVCSLILASVADAPVAGQSREERAHMQMAAELRILQEQQQQLALAIAGLAQSLNDATKAITGRLNDNNEAMKKGFADQGLAIGRIENDVRGIGERSRDSVTRLGELKEEVEALRRAMLSMAARPVSVTPPADPLDPNAPPPDVSQIQVPDSALPSAIGLTARLMYDTGYADYASGNYASAISSFEQLIKANPASEWADDAQFYIGEAEFQQRRFEQAVAAYNLVIKNYPRGDVLPGAYYKLGVAHENLQRADSARAAWQELIKQFPNTFEAGLAKQGLGRIEKTLR